MTRDEFWMYLMAGVAAIFALRGSFYFIQTYWVNATVDLTVAWFCLRESFRLWDRITV